MLMTSLAEIVQAINKLNYGTAEYHEAMAMLMMFMARAQWREADLARKRKHERPR